MTGSISKYSIVGSRKPRWRYRIYRGKDQNGQKHYVGKAGFAREREAQSAMREHLREIVPLTRGRYSLAGWLEKWLQTYAPIRCKSLKTIERYRELAGYLISGTTPELSEVANADLADLSHTTLEPVFLSLFQVKGKRREHLSARTVRHVGSLVKVALHKAFLLDLISANPMLKVELPSAEPREVRSLTPGEIQLLRDSCLGDWTFALVDLALATGCRRGELLALEWSDLNWKTQTLTLSKSLEQTAAGLRIKTTKNGKSRVCTLPRVAIEALRIHRGRESRSRLIFPGEDGSYLKPDLISQTIVRRMKKAGIQDASLHTLRHTHATNLLSRGIPLPAISARLGHADPSVTARIYCHALPLDDQRIADEWDSLLGIAV